MRIVNDYNENKILALAQEGLKVRLRRQYTAQNRVRRAQQRLKELETANDELVTLIGNPYQS
jgi:regulator of replication initiation timing